MDFLSTNPFTGTTSKCGASAGTTTTLTTANITDFAIASKAYRRAAISNAAVPTTDAVTGAAFLPIPIGTASVSNGQGGFTEGFGQGCTFVVGLNAALAIRVVQGPIVRTTPGAVATSVFQAVAGQPSFGIIPDNFSPICYILVKTDSTTGAAWTFGTSNLNGPPAGTTITFTDLIGGMPDRPQAT